MGKKKILFVSSTLETGGIEMILSNLSIYLQEKYEVEILLNGTEHMELPYGGRIVSLNMKYQKNMMSLWYQMKAFVKKYFCLKKMKKRGNYTVCISMHDSANVVNILTGNKYCRVITTVYTDVSASKYSKINRFIVIPAIKCFYNRSDFIVVTSEGSKRDLEINYGLNPDIMKVIYDGVDISKIKSMIKPLSNGDHYFNEGRIISTLGRLDTAKAQWHLIRAMKGVIKEYTDAKLLIMGTGALESSLAELIEQCGLKNHVKLCGFVENPYQYIADSEVFALSSIVEGYPTVLLEALVCGTPCVSTDFSSGAREILAPGSDIELKQKDSVELAEYGILTPVCDGKFRNGEEPLTREEKLLAEGILAYLRNEKLQRDVKRRINEYSKQFSIERCVQLWMDVLEQQFLKGR